jgi:putative hemolysin
MKRRWISTGYTLVVGASVLTACCAPPAEESGLANPASVHCEEQGYTLEMRTDENGTYGVCIFPDGTECEEWAYYRGECGPREQEVTVAGPTPPASLPAPATPINLVELAGLRDTAEIEILEFAMADVSDYVHRLTIAEPGVIASIVAALDVELDLGPRVRCPASHLLRFQLADGSVEQFGYGCDAEAPVFLRGEQAFWNGQDAQPPEQFSALIQAQLASSPQQTPVVGWYGHVASLPEGGQYDDYVVLHPEGAGEFGVVGVDDGVEAQVVALRDQEEPGKYAHFWGTLTCGVDDHAGCQLVVARLRVDAPGPFLDPDPIDGWEGLVVADPPQSQWDDHFVLSGKYLVHYGIGSVDPEVAAELESVREPMTPVRVWGELTCGVPDSNGCHIEVTRIEIAGEPLAQ